MSMSIVTAAAVPGGTDVLFLARVRAANFALITQATVSTITWTLTDITPGVNYQTVVGTGTFAVAATVFNSLVQSDLSWTKDSANNLGADGAWGYNFAATLPAAGIVPSGDTFQLETKLAIVGGTTLRLVWQFNTVQVFGS